MECSICYDDVQPNYPETGGVYLLCGHVFHRECIVGWFAQSAGAVCPYCRRGPTTAKYINEMTALVERCSWKIHKMPTLAELKTWCAENNRRLDHAYAARLLLSMNHETCEWLYEQAIKHFARK